MQSVINNKTLKLFCCIAVMHAGVASADLNDTGIVVIDPGAPAGQDAHIGRDPAAADGVLPKTGSGSKGFDFSKIANDGSSLPDTAALGTEPGDWACTLDNVTGRIWEVKADDGLRDKNWDYTWFSSDSNSNGGDPGMANGGNCFDSDNCDTEKYAAAVNSLSPALCGYDDWRLPSHGELLSIVDFGSTSPPIDTTFFPNNNIPVLFWSASVFTFDPSRVWGVTFVIGNDSDPSKDGTHRARLVRGGQ